MDENWNPEPVACNRCGLIHVKCTAHTKSGKPCGRNRTRGMMVCKMHGGAGRHVQGAIRRRLALEVVSQELKLGGQLNVAPAEAMLAMVREAAWNVAMLRELVRELDHQPTPEGDLAAASLMAGEGGDAQPAWGGLNRAIAGRVDFDTLKAERHIVVRMYDDERERLVKWAKLCRDAGVEERMVRVAEEQGLWLTRTLDYVLDGLGLTPEQLDRVPELVRAIARESGLEIIDVEVVEESDP